MKPNIYDFILSLFTNNDELRPALSVPGIIEDKAYSTDAHACIRFSKDLSNMQIAYLKNEKFPNAKAIFEDLEFENETSLTVNDILLGFYDCKLQIGTVFENCDSCDGYGTKDCQCCGNEAECDNCNGSGGNDKIEPFSGLTLSGENIMLLGKLVRPHLLYKVAHTALLLGTKTINLKTTKKNQLIFTFSDVEVLVMAIYNPDN